MMGTYKNNINMTHIKMMLLSLQHAKSSSTILKKCGVFESQTSLL